MPHQAVEQLCLACGANSSLLIGNESLLHFWVMHVIGHHPVILHTIPILYRSVIIACWKCMYMYMPCLSFFLSKHLMDN